MVDIQRALPQDEPFDDGKLLFLALDSGGDDSFCVGPRDDHHAVCICHQKVARLHRDTAHHDGLADRSGTVGPLAGSLDADVGGESVAVVMSHQYESMLKG